MVKEECLIEFFLNVYYKYRTYILSTLTFQNKRILKPWEII